MTASPSFDQSFEDQFPRPHDNCYWVIPGRFLAGEYPGAYRAESARLRLQSYLAAGITDFLDLTHPDDGLMPYEAFLNEVSTLVDRQVTYQRLPIYDMSVPDRQQMIAVLDTIDALLSRNRSVYIHCWGGIGRTGTVVGCHLVRHGLDGGAALAQIATWWQSVEKSVRSPRSPETDELVAMIHGWGVGE